MQVSRFVQLHDTASLQKGVTLFMGFDFHEYVSITRAIPTKGPTFPIFRPDRSPIKSGEGYWIIGVDKKNEIVLSDAVRLYDLSQSNFAEHLQSLKAFYADPTIHSHPQDRCTCTAPNARKITGKVTYNGDLWVREDFRGGGIAQIITRIVFRVSFVMWAPDFLCALVARWRVEKGSVAQYRHYEPGGAMLQLVEDDILEDNWLIWLTGAELRSQVEHTRTELILGS
ncbi:hypothetical protein H8A95_08920 [Bradyrhizobium sp. Pear76]|uniref:hypothetical protein n=1 Tax=Bradyrhizobium oropedii TaxID=1571201 RepID=UPI001E5A0FCA|nr:hypothetical protein [Bradyrhizobium oropedii]MCC8962439.1 hypothetical protein [Bradyrhizobium oropedii]